MLNRRFFVLSLPLALPACGILERFGGGTSGSATPPPPQRQPALPAAVVPPPPPTTQPSAVARAPLVGPNDGVKGYAFYVGRVNKSRERFVADLFDETRRPKQFHRVVTWQLYQRELVAAGFSPPADEAGFRKFLEQGQILNSNMIQLGQFEMGLIRKDDSIAYWVRKDPYPGELFLAWRISGALVPGISLGCGNPLRLPKTIIISQPVPPRPGRINCPDPCPAKPK